MKQMWDGTVEPAIVSMNPDTKSLIQHFVIKTFGMGESDMERTLPDLIRRGRKPTVGITASYATITLRITTEGDSPEECEQQATETINTIKSCLGDLIYAYHECEIQDVVSSMLETRGESVAVLESGTQGLVSHHFHNTGNAGTVVGPCRLETNLVSLGDAEQHDLTTAAAEFHASHNSDYSIVVGDILTGGPNEVDSLEVVIATNQGTEQHSFRFTGHSDIRVPKAAKQAINCLRLHLLKETSKY